MRGGGVAKLAPLVAARWLHDLRRRNAWSAGMGCVGAGARGRRGVGVMTLPSPEDMQAFLAQIAAAQAAVTTAQTAYDAAQTQLSYAKAQLRDLQSRAKAQFDALVGT